MASLLEVENQNNPILGRSCFISLFCPNAIEASWRVATQRRRPDPTTICLSVAETNFDSKLHSLLDVSILRPIIGCKFHPDSGSSHIRIPRGEGRKGADAMYFEYRHTWMSHFNLSNAAFMGLLHKSVSFTNIGSPKLEIRRVTMLISSLETSLLVSDPDIN